MIHRAKGTISRQGGVNTPAGTYEESFGRQGFYGPQAKLYRRHPTTDWLRIEGPLQPRALRTYDVVPDDMADPQGLPATLLYNDDVRLAVSRRQESMPFFLRNADGDELHFIHQGQGRFECDFGTLPFETRVSVPFWGYESRVGGSHRSGAGATNYRTCRALRSQRCTGGV